MMQQLGDRSRDRVGDRSSSDVMADTLKFECERRAVVQDRTTYGIAMEGVYLCWLLLRLISTGRWQKGSRAIRDGPEAACHWPT